MSGRSHMHRSSESALFWRHPIAADRGPYMTPWPKAPVAPVLPCTLFLRPYMLVTGSCP